MRVRPVNLALAGRVETALGAMRTAPLVLIDLEMVEGVVGRSYLRCYTPHALPASAPPIDDLGDVIAGAAVDPRGLNDKLRRQSRLLGWQGLTGIAMAGIEMAAWDACAETRDAPREKLLGGQPQPIPAYASLRTMSPGAPAADAGEAVARGFAGVKLKVGADQLARDLESNPRGSRRHRDKNELLVDYQPEPPSGESTQTDTHA